MLQNKLVLECQQDMMWKPNMVPINDFEKEVDFIGNYKELGIIFEREFKGEVFVYEMDYYGEGNQFTEEFPEAVSAWDFIGTFYCASDGDKNRGGCRAKIKCTGM